SQQAHYGGNPYPRPVCEHEQAARAARKAIGEFRKQNVSRAEPDRVLQRHGSRKGPVQKRPSVPAGDNRRDDQLSLFD
ncbi:MAG: deoxyribodipyrimidine photo-lyase, partial [Pseudomonadota bacterium]|nr:deoxyribodipyrimidine photo-lyase [Pseudomonadota bacterium]